MGGSIAEKNGPKRMGADPFWMGVLFTLLGGSLWGFSGTSVQYLTTEGGATPPLVTFMRVLVGGGILFFFILATRRDVLLAMMRSKRSLVGISLFALSLYGNQLCYAQTVQITNAGTATVLQMLGSVFVMLFVCSTERHLPHLREFIGLILAALATTLIATQGDISTLSIPADGLIWGILAGVTTAVYILVPKCFGLFERFGSISVVGVGMLLSTVFAFPGFLVQGGSLDRAASMLSGFGAYEWAIFVFGLVMAGTIGGYGLYLHGVSIVGSVKGSLLGAIEPMSATIIAATWLATSFTIYDVAGMILMCIMVACISGSDDEAAGGSGDEADGSGTSDDGAASGSVATDGVVSEDGGSSDEEATA